MTFCGRPRTYSTAASAFLRCATWKWWKRAKEGKNLGRMRNDAGSMSNAREVSGVRDPKAYDLMKEIHGEYQARG